MVAEQIEKLVHETIRNTFGCRDAIIGRDTQAEDIDGWDSLSHGLLLLRLQETFGTKLHYQEVYDLANVGDLVDYIEKQLTEIENSP